MRCEDEKMFYRPPLLEEPCAQTLSGKTKTLTKPWNPGNLELWNLGTLETCNLATLETCCWVAKLGKSKYILQTRSILCGSMWISSSTSKNPAIMATNGKYNALIWAASKESGLEMSWSMQPMTGNHWGPNSACDAKT